MTAEELIDEIEAQRSIMVSISTGGYGRIMLENDDYKARRQRISQELTARHLPDPNPHYDLFRWHGKWSSGDLPTYSSRRSYIGEMYDPLIERIRTPPQVGSDLFTEATGWPRVDRTVDRIRGALETATLEEEYQIVGLLCRECIVSLAQAIYDPAIHRPQDAIPPSDTDANRMIEGYITHELSGGSNEEIRRSVKAALSLASALVHRRTAGFIDAAVCAEATLSVINVLAIISGHRGPS